MQNFSKVAPIYGYLVCLTAIIVTFISLNMLITSLFNWQDPLHATSYMYDNRNLSSFEAFKLETNSSSSLIKISEPTPATTKLTDAELRVAYESARDNKIASVRFASKQSATQAIILLVFSAFLFFTHWRWVQKLTNK